MNSAQELLLLGEALVDWSAAQGCGRNSSAIVAALHDISSEITVGIPATLRLTIDPSSTAEDVLQSLSDLSMRLNHIRDHADEAATALAELSASFESRKPE